MYKKQQNQNSKEEECYNANDDHHLTQSFKMGHNCQCGMETKVRIDEIQKRLAQLINDKTDKLYELIQCLTKKIEQLTGLPQPQLAINNAHLLPQAYEFQMLEQSSKENENTLPSGFMHLSQSQEEFQQSTNKIILEEQSLLGQPYLILDRLKNCFLKMDLQFNQCKKIYDFPEMKGIDFHTEIDNKNDILFVAELENNEVVGAFTHRCFDPKHNYIPKENKKSFLFNLTRDKFAFASRANKILTYDANYFILGNWEIKVKNGENILETTWGTKGDCFQYTTFGGNEKHTMKRSDFFGQGSDKGMKMNRYAFYAFS